MRDVILCECFARDGLQHEPDFIATEAKLALIERFAVIGFERIEATSYSNPKVVPQFADASDLLRRLPRRSLQGRVRTYARSSGRSATGARLRRERSACSCRRPSRTRGPT
jgi:isopropylmalate/homocitrate/citramalate synthase